MKTGLKRGLLCTLAGLTALAPLSSCGKKNKIKDTETNVIMQLYLGGFGSEGFEAVKKRFEEIYAEEGYTVTIIPGAHLVGKQVTDTLQLGPTITKTDLFFGGGFDHKPVVAQGKSFLQDATVDCALEDLTQLYESKVYGENVTLKDKMFSDFANYSSYEGKYWTVSWNASITGLLYNADLFEVAGETELPRTSDELLALVERIKDRKEIPFTFTGKASYWEYCALPWWRQFASDEEVEDFWNCLNASGEESPDVFKSHARLQAFKIVEACIGDADNFNERALKDTHIEAQTRFYDGTEKIWMMPSGSWAENEMSLNGYKAGKKDIGMMRVPVSSSVIYTDVDKTNYRFETVRDDAKLSEVVKAVDEGKTGVEGVAATEFEAIKKMRRYVSTEGYASSVVIPSYANAKEAAKKFLLFLASDEAGQIYYDATKTYLPFNTSNIKTGDTPTRFQSDVRKIMKDVSFVSKYDSKNPLFFMTDMTFTSNQKFMDLSMATTETSEKMTAEKWMDYIHRYVSENFDSYQSLANAVK